MNFLGQDLFQWLRPSVFLGVPTEELPPLVNELFGREHLERYARDLGAAHAEVRRGGRNSLLVRLADNEHFTAEATTALTDLIICGGRVPPAGEWLIDNHFLVVEQVRIARLHLPRSYSWELPLLLKGPDAGFPRVYVLALEFITHVDGCVDSDMLRAFLTSYQSRRVLTMGELWGIPIMLRLALVENVRRVAARLVHFVTDNAAARAWAERMIAEAENAPHQVILIVADLARSGQELSSPFVAELMRRLHGQNPAVVAALSWIESSLASRGLNTESVVLRESSQQAADQIAIAHSIGSLRQLDAIDWDVFVEDQSAVDRILRADPAGAYALMNFITRDRYRHVIEDIARRALRTETHIAQLAINLASTAKEAGDTEQSHVGAWLVRPHGLARLEQESRARWDWRRLPIDILRATALPAYLGLGLLMALAAVLLLVAVAPSFELWQYIVLGLLAVLAISGPALAFVNHCIAKLVPPWPVPRMDFSKGIPFEHRTVVAVPCMLESEGAVDRLVEQLELRWLANRDPSLSFVLLTDFCDADSQNMPHDEVLAERARSGIAAINAQHGPHFYLLHRERLWNERSACWMGFERKRGKLAALNRLLLQGDSSAFPLIVGDTANLLGTPYVLVLDADTQLPGGSAASLIGAMAHPLNRPVLDQRRGLVIAGHALIQPRVAATLTSANRSWFAWMSASDAGIDPYVRSVSNVYQDLFDEGSFVGKGIYDVAVFQTVFTGRLPDNRILSHDLLEGCYLRSACDSETLLFEDIPASYMAEVTRRQRWTRGDWQVARWILPRPPGLTGRVPNPLSLLSRWKLLDNLRRSVAPLAWVVLLSFAILVPEGMSAFLILLGFFVLPYALPVITALLQERPQAGYFAWVGQVTRVTVHSGTECLFALAILPHEAVWSLASILRTFWRITISQRRQLEWTTSAVSERRTQKTLLGMIGNTWPVWFLAIVVATGALCIGIHPGRTAICFLWLATPILVWLASRLHVQNTSVLSKSQDLWLRRLGRQTWSWFEAFVGPEDNYLPPDNTHERAQNVVAHRTSPTNMGLSLLADLTACDFGWATPTQLLGRVGATLATMERLDRHRGHFFNWYDTTDLRVLAPRYVSTVDSGNLVAHLLVLRRGLMEIADRPIQLAVMIAGLRDTAALALEGLDSSPEVMLSLEHHIDALLDVENGESSIIDRLDDLYHAALTIQTGNIETDDEGRRWIGALIRESVAWRDFLLLMAPWRRLGPPPDAGCAMLLAYVAVATTPRAIAGLRQKVIPLISGSITQTTEEAREWLARFHEAVEAGSRQAAALIDHLTTLAARCEDLADADFAFLYDQDRELFVIGVNTTEQRRDTGTYDLLASEARLVSYLAIALGQVPQRHWFRLGRLIADCDGGRALVSWSGSMFEYLMPNLVMPEYRGTLLDATNRSMVQTQIAYGHARGIPWGVSESGYLLIDQHLNYQYRAFGVPGLGLKRGLGDDVVIAPYASALALIVAPAQACANLERLVSEGRSGRFGLYEAIDYTPARLPRGETSATVMQYMVHHQAMTLLAMAQVLLGRPMQRRFRADLRLRAVDLLLQERVPHLVGAVRLHDVTEESSQRPLSEETVVPIRLLTGPCIPGEINILSNGRYQVMTGSGGGGWSRWHGLALTRWHEDSTLENTGFFCYLRDLNTGKIWSNTFQPTQTEPEEFQAIFTQAKTEYTRLDHDLFVHTEIAVSPEDDVEVRRVTLRNRSSRDRSIEVTTYAEVVLATQNADASHPAFHNLFVQTESLGDGRTLLATRRPRTPSEKPPWMLHLVNIANEKDASPSFETDRVAFIGRGRSLLSPTALVLPGPLAGGVGAVLDPIFSLRRILHIPANGQATIDLILGVAENREAAEALASRYREVRFTERVFQLAWTQAQVALRLLSVSEQSAQLFARLAGGVVYPMRHRRAPAAMLTRNRRGQSGLWVYGISGDLPIMLVRIADGNHIELVRDTVQAHAWFRAKGLEVDLVILIDDHSSYRQTLHDTVVGLIAAGHEAAQIDRPGGIFIRRGDQMPEDDRIMFLAMARIVLSDNAGTFAEQVERRSRGLPSIPLINRRYVRIEDLLAPQAYRDDLIFRNDHGGFTGDGREYVIILRAGEKTPAPWVNVLANEHFGTLISERGSAYTWLENSHEYRLTPWHNDPVSDRSGEALWIRDQDTGRFWSPSSSGGDGVGTWVVRHGMGYSVFEHTEDNLATECWHYVAIDAPVKLISIRLKNHGNRTKHLAIAGYWEWVLGELRERNLMHVVTEIDGRSGALLARNPYHPDFPKRVAFVDCSESLRTCTGDRAEMLGNGGSVEFPKGLLQTHLSDRVGAGLDPCAALMVPIEIPAGEEREVIFILGVGSDTDDVQQLVQRFRSHPCARRALEAVWEFWKNHLGTIQVETPDPAVNILANAWLPYQVLACRFWARTGFYQSGGAFGFRDQLQDSMALLPSAPNLVRQHLLLAASRQYSEGDVQHWWHPPGNRGVRTHMSDDALWLPYAAAHYALTTADSGVFDEVVPFINGRAVRSDEDSYFDSPTISSERGTLYEHCRRTLDRAIGQLGTHGLPLIGSGDWNDGMNLVGVLGKGESVWLGFFLVDCLRRFALIAAGRGEESHAKRWRLAADQLVTALESQAWDGSWYTRAWFDDGRPLGSRVSPECSIDSLPQSWAVLSGAGNPLRARQALAQVDSRLVDRQARLIKLFDPPFDTSNLEPGYIKGYVPGVRENGGQYTHAAIWVAMAFAQIGDNAKAWELFNLLSPVHHGDSAANEAVYHIEPYVVAADIYSVAPHKGRGGWSWYTGSAGWMYRLLIEDLLGVRREGDHLLLSPKPPPGWKQYTVHYRHYRTNYHIVVTCGNGGTQQSLKFDGKILSVMSVPLIDDGQDHLVEIEHNKRS